MSIAAATAVLTVATPLSAQAIGGNCSVSGVLQAATGDTFAAADTLTWNTTSNSACVGVTYKLNGKPVAADGSLRVDPWNHDLPAHRVQPAVFRAAVENH